MTGRTLAVNTTAVDEDGRMVTFMAGTTVSAKVAEGITNPKAWGDGDESSEPKAVADMGKAELQAEVDRRNAERPEAEAVQVEGKGTVADLRKALEADAQSV